MVAICDTERLDSRPAAAAAAADEDGTVRHPVALPLVPMLAPRVQSKSGDWKICDDRAGDNNSCSGNIGYTVSKQVEEGQVDEDEEIEYDVGVSGDDEDVDAEEEIDHDDGGDEEGEVDEDEEIYNDVVVMKQMKMKKYMMIVEVVEMVKKQMTMKKLLMMVEMMNKIMKIMKKKIKSIKKTKKV